MVKTSDWRQIKVLLSANLKARYRGTFWGFAWVVLNPALQYTAQAIAFHFFLRLDVKNYPLFLLTGVLPWVFWTSTVDMSTTALVSQSKLIKSFPISPLVILSSLVLENCVGFLVTFFLLLMGLLVYYGQNLIALVLLLLPLALLLLASFGLSVICSFLHVTFRDTKFVVSFSIQILFFLTPIFYPAERVPEEFKFLIAINPFYYLITPFRTLATDPLGIQFVMDCLRASAVAAIFLFGAWMIYRKRINRIYHEL